MSCLCPVKICVWEPNASLSQRHKTCDRNNVLHSQRHHTMLPVLELHTFTILYLLAFMIQVAYSAPQIVPTLQLLQDLNQQTKFPKYDQSKCVEVSKSLAAPEVQIHIFQPSPRTGDAGERDFPSSKRCGKATRRKGVGMPVAPTRGRQHGKQRVCWYKKHDKFIVLSIKNLSNMVYR